MRLGEGDILVFRTGHHARRLALGAWSNDYPPAGEGKAGLHVDTIPWMHERQDRGLPPRRRRRDGAQQRRGHALPDPPAPADRDGHAASPTACSSRSWPRPARRRVAGSSWSSGCRSACPAPPARPGTRSRSSDERPRAWPQAPSTTPADDPAGRAKGTPDGTRLAASRSSPAAAPGSERPLPGSSRRQDVAVAVCGRRRGELDRTVAAIEGAGGAAMAVPADHGRSRRPAGDRRRRGRRVGSDRRDRQQRRDHQDGTVRGGDRRELFDTHVAVNVRGPYFLVQAALPWLRVVRRAGRGLCLVVVGIRSSSPASRSTG